MDVIDSNKKGANLCVEGFVWIPHIYTHLNKQRWVPAEFEFRNYYILTPKGKIFAVLSLKCELPWKLLNKWFACWIKRGTRCMFNKVELKRWQPSTPYLIFVIFFTRTKFLENKIYTKIYTVNCQFTQKIANLHSKWPIFCVKSVKNYTGQKKFTRTCPWRPWQIWGMLDASQLVVSGSGKKITQISGSRKSSIC